MRRESGFTLIELFVVMAISTILMTLGAAAVRHFWFMNAVDKGAEQVQSELRQLQQRATAQSHPMVYGAWFRTGGTNSTWGILKFDPKTASTATDDVCTQVGGPEMLPDGATFSAADFNMSTAATIESKCTSVAPAGSKRVYFYARGTATPGSVTVHQTNIAESRTLTVSALTGRVDES
jgi:prepilin-type N-terminal cleavage/methylation domain-containing protein